MYFGKTNRKRGVLFRPCGTSNLPLCRALPVVPPPIARKRRGSRNDIRGIRQSRIALGPGRIDNRNESYARQSKDEFSHIPFLSRAGKSPTLSNDSDRLKRSPKGAIQV